MLQEEVLNGCQCFQMVGCTLYVVLKNRAPGFEQLWEKEGKEEMNCDMLQEFLH